MPDGKEESKPKSATAFIRARADKRKANMGRVLRPNHKRGGRTGKKP